MDQDKFAAILPVTIGGLLNKIIAETQLGNDEAFEKLYNSVLYAELENEKTKLWTYSAEMLYEIYKTEADTGKLELPDF